MPSFPDSAVVTFPLPASGPGGEGVDLNYARTQFGYDSAGRQNRVVAPEGTITRTTFDPLGRQIGLYVGTKLYKLYYSGDIIGPGGPGRFPARGSHRPERAQLTHSVPQVTPSL